MFFGIPLLFLWCNKCYQSDLWFLWEPFLNSAWTSVSSRFMYYWSLAWRILSITLLACEIVKLCSSLSILWHHLSWDWRENWPFPVLWPRLFSKCAGMLNAALTISSFNIWNSSAGIPSPPLALFIVMLPKAHLTSLSRMSGCKLVRHHRGYLGHEDLFCIVLLCVIDTFFKYLLLLLHQYHFCL